MMDTSLYSVVGLYCHVHAAVTRRRLTWLRESQRSARKSRLLLVPFPRPTESCSIGAVHLLKLTTSTPSPPWAPAALVAHVFADA